MIFYFTGTGNSLYAAGSIAEALGDRLISIAGLMDGKKDVYRYEMGENELLGFVFPVYAWGPPKMVTDFIGKLEILGKPYVFSLCTCGDNEGHASKVVKKALSKKGLTLDSAFSLRMPNNFIMGFDVDSKEVAEKKLEDAALLLSEINKSISRREKGLYLTTPGRFPALKTGLVYPIFNRFSLSTRHFSVNDACTGCGICETVCPIHTIEINDGRPVWKTACTQCLGCLHRCPARAIQYGKGAARKGRYCHPDLERLERRVSDGQKNF